MRRQRGQAIVLVATMMAVLVGFVALAIDSARLLDSRRIMQDAVDNAALGAAEYYQNNPSGWSGAETEAINVFAEDMRLYTSHSCTPGSVSPSAGAPGTSLSMTCTYGASGAQLQITAEDDGPAGQSFVMLGQKPMNVALMQVLGQSPTITVQAAAAATAADVARAPVLAGLSQAGCFGATGTYPLSVSSFTNPLTVIGDTVANGTYNVGSFSFIHEAGNVLTRCAAPVNSGHISYYCWPGGAAPACAGGNVVGRQLSTSYHYADPGYSTPATPAGTVGFNATNVQLAPGIYATDPNFGSAVAHPCYFLAGGEYLFQSGLTFSQGIVSNELKPPDEPVAGNNTARATPQFWDDNSAACGGPQSGTCSTTVFTGCSISLGSGSSSGRGIANGTWSVVVTSLRTDTYNGVSMTRESAPSMCHQIAISGSDKTLNVTVGFVPGATTYSVYAAPPPNGCAGPFGLVGNINAAVTQTQGSLGSATGSWDSTVLTTSPAWAPSATAAPDTMLAYPPSSQTAAWSANGATLPNQNPARSASPAGDRANENACATAVGAVATCPAALTPGAVQVYLTNTKCFSLNSGGDAYLFGGYQYDWVLAYEPAATTCTNNWVGTANSALVGLSYTPGAAFAVNAKYGFSYYTGGVIAYTIQMGITAPGATNLAIEYSSLYAPTPGGTRLTG